MDSGETRRRRPPSDTELLWVPSDHSYAQGGTVGCDCSFPQIVESTSSVWTDEKHSSYLNSMEESFVRELYSGEVCSTDRFLNCSASNSGDRYSGQFKVQRRGCWEDLRFERRQLKQKSYFHDSKTLSANAWINHFRSPTVGNWMEERTCDGMKTDPRQHPIYLNPYGEQSVGNCTEVSDQNFVYDDFKEDNKAGKACRKKRMWKFVSGASTDQEVPHGKSSVRHQIIEN